MGWIKNTLGAGFAVAVIGSVAGLWGPDDIKEGTKRGVDGGFAVGEGVAEAVPDNVERILTDRGYDVENMTAEDWAEVAADKTKDGADVLRRFVSRYGAELGVDTSVLDGFTFDSTPDGIDCSKADHEAGDCENPLLLPIEDGFDNN